MAEAGQAPLDVGKISGVFGVKGWVKVYSYTDPREGISNYSPWLIKVKGHWREYEVEAAQRQGKTIIAKLKGVDEREQAQLLTGAMIAIRPAQLEALDRDEYYWHQLEGLKVITTQGDDLGQVSHMLATGANDVMVVRGDRERLIPFTQGHAVHKVDLATGVITVDWDPDF
ncbi:MAG: ribosome maturation factor RimM [Gammaproteobacteria bacterium]|nr:MAG: ribosome maturation factor RimM [Gammaproteobacteria bacterium]